MKRSQRNNKASRAKKHKKRIVPEPVHDGTESLRSTAARRKLRRWTFEADVQIMSESRDLLPPQRLRMESVVFGDVSDARAEIPNQIVLLHGATDMFKEAVIDMRVVPHETVSPEVMAQLNKSQNMCMMLDKALELSVLEGFTTIPAEAKSVAEAKELMFQKAIDWYKNQSKPEVEIKPDFEPEIVEIGKKPDGPTLVSLT